MMVSFVPLATGYVPITTGCFGCVKEVKNMRRASRRQASEILAEEKEKVYEVQ